MPTITAIEITHHRLELDPPFVAAWDGRARHEFTATLVRVKDDEGREGVGSGDLMVGFDGHEQLFVGKDPRSLERHFEVLSHIDFHYGRCWPLDLALWDLNGKIAGEPVWRLLGGQSGRVQTYASCGARRSAAEMADRALQLVEGGFPAMKVRLSSTSSDAESLRRDLDALSSIRERIGDRLEIMVDCNQGWRMPWDTTPPWSYKEALHVARELERLDVYWMEEPLHRGDVEGMRRLSDATELSIAGGEMTRDLDMLRTIIDRRALDILQPDAALVGGITGLRRIALAARSAGMRFTPHTWTNGLGVVANAHLAAGVGAGPFLEWPFDPPEWSLDRRDFTLSRPLALDGATLVLSDAPGFGVELNEELLAKTRIRS